MAVAVRAPAGCARVRGFVLSPSDVHPHSTSLTCRTQCLSLRVQPKELGKKGLISSMQ